MKDNRQPIDVYNQLLEQKTAWNCSILEAADRVESERAREGDQEPFSQEWSGFPDMTTPDPTWPGEGVL